MPMNLVIQQKRKALGLTQVQIADYLNVSTPAVSKWERGVTCPDVELLPSLARLLKTDLNTLLCFREELTGEDLTAFCKEINGLFHQEGMQAAFDAAVKKLHEYPHNEMLLHTMVLQLEGLLNMSGLPGEELEAYSPQLEKWYQRLSQSSDPKISNAANYMMVSRCIRREDYDRAQAVLDTMPARDDILSTMADKLFMQVNIDLHQGRADKAAGDLQKALYSAVNKVQMLLYKLVEAELAAGEGETARAVAETSEQLTELFDMWSYGGLVAPLQIAQAKHDGDTAVRILGEMLNAMTTPWNKSRAPLFNRMTGSVQSNQQQMLPAILKELEQDQAYEFLRGREDFQTLIAEYRERI